MKKDKKFMPILTVLLSIFLVSGICVGNVDLSLGTGLVTAPLPKAPILSHTGSVDADDIELASAASKKRIGSWKSNVYHKPTCRYVKAIKKSNKRTFSSATTAKKAGYRACKICRW